MSKPHPLVVPWRARSVPGHSATGRGADHMLFRLPRSRTYTQANYNAATRFTLKIFLPRGPSDY
jgi:hypothetical protein